MKQCFLIPVIFLNLLLNAQTTFEKRFAIHIQSTAHRVVQLSDESYVIAGDDRYWESSDPQDFVLIKLNKKGELLWSENYGSMDYETLNDMKQTYDKGFVMLGYTVKNLMDESDIYLVKTDSTGKLVWEKTFPFLGRDTGKSIVQTSDSGYMVTGISNVHVGYTDVDRLLIMRLDKYGEIIWRKANDNQYAGGQSIIPSNDGCYYVCGYTRCENNDYFNIMLSKFTAEGDSLWSRNYGDYQREYGMSVKQLKNGDLIIAGYRVDTLSYSSVNSYFIKCNAEGDTLWTREFDGVGYDISYEVEITSDSCLVFVGFGEMVEKDNYDAYLLKISLDNKIIWKQEYGGTSTEFGRDVIHTKDGGFMMCGIALDFYLSGYNSRGIYLVKTDSLGQIAYTSLAENKPMQFNLFPNPGNGDFSIRTKEPVSAIEIIDMYGKQRYYEALRPSQTEYTYRGRKLNSGCYIIKVSNRQGFSSCTLIVE
ncbi:MAG: T9SS type A sorting domain-containing protein [Bacteroidetes bacterium]|nr:T9SS type A sorting domain-containing protein [Bacteroidales bacterium]MBU1010782.1 T9SS type A sorting domain-containing protein [Bacteroidota bacterium]